MDCSAHFLVGHLPPFQLLLSNRQIPTPLTMNLKKSGQHQLPGSNLILPPIPSTGPSPSVPSATQTIEGQERVLRLKEAAISERWLRPRQNRTHLKPTKTPRACVFIEYFYSLCSSRRERDLNFRVGRDAAWEM